MLTKTDAGSVVWRKSTHSNPSGDCVELAVLSPELVGVRNSRFPAGSVLAFGRGAIREFVDAVGKGEFDQR